MMQTKKPKGSVFKRVATCACALLLAACAVTQGNKQSLNLRTTDSIALLPIANHTDVPQAGLRAEAIAESSLRANGLRQLQMYPIALNPETLFEPSERKAQAEAEKWAKAQGIRYVVYGSVDEWRYKVGVDGEPAVGLVFQVKDLSTGQVVYSASGGKSGWSREALSAVAQKLTVDLLSGVALAVEKPVAQSNPTSLGTPPVAPTAVPAANNAPAKP
jgi:polysaccharide biosynthesis protein PelC